MAIFAIGRIYLAESYISWNDASFAQKIPPKLRSVLKQIKCFLNVL